MQILVTGFEPFGQDNINASAEILTRLPATLGEHQISTAILPVSFARAGAALEQAIHEHRPEALICLGEAGGRRSITPELWGYNLDEARIADNDGHQPQTWEIFPGGPQRIRSSIDPAPLIQTLQQAGIPAELSEDPGRFLCNHVAFCAYRSSVPAVFIHVPAARPSGQRARVGAETDGHAPVGTDLDFDQLSRAIELCLSAL